ncbi:calcium-binding protein [Enterobacter kobei]|uniref:calcium-binding protein n=1 Tax=Enterobacter kobei TaxID=208224 RepID=UPI003A9832EF
METRGSSLVIYAYGDTDSVTVSNYFSGNSYRQLVLVCDDGTLTQADLTERVMPQTGTDGNDSLSGWEYGDSISGGAGHDSLRGNNGDDVLDGGTGNDSLYGGAGNDLLDGGAGDDLLDGGNDSADRYVFRQGHGRDTVSDYSSDEDTADTLVFSGARTADLWFEKRGSSLVIYAYGDTDSVTVSNYFSGNSYRQLVLVCDDGTLTQADLTERVMPQTGTDGNDSLSGWEYGDSISGGAGHDSLRGNNGDDVLDGGTGNDSLYGGAGNDLLDGGAGDDLLDGGNDSADRYVFRQGHGRDTVSDYSSDEDTADTLVFSGARTADLWFEKRGSSLVIYAYGDTDSVTVSNYFSGNSYRQLVLVCDDGTLTQADLTERVMPQTGTDGNDSLSGWEYGDSISGGAGHDSLRGNNGDDVLDGGTGNDSLYGGAGNDLLDGGAGDDLLDGGNDSADRYVFRQGHGRDTVSDYSSDEDTADTLVFSGARTADLWFEKRGSSLVIYAYGDTDSVTVSNYFSGNSHRQLVLVCDDGTLTQADLTERVMPQTGTDGNDSLSGWEYGDSISGGAGHDSLRGNNGDDVLDGGTGNDSLYGGAGNDLLDGGAGDDLLDGGNDSADRYVFRQGHGRDTVSDYSSDEDTADTLVFSGARTADLWFEKRGSSLVIYAYGDTDSVTVSNYFSGNSYRQLVLVCDDGTLTQADLTERVMPQTGTDGNDSLSGWEYGDSISGGAGHDSLRGNNGDDVLDGGTGNDSLYGGAGNDLLDGGAGDDLLDGGNDSADRYVFREGHGNDMVSDSSKNSTTADTLVFSGAQSSAVRLEKNGNDLLIRAYGDEDSVRVSGYFSSADYRHIALQFDDRTMTAEMLAGQEFLSLGTEANNNLYGWSGTDRLEGQAGDDYMQGYDGQDTLDGGTGNDKLYGGNDSADRYVFRQGHGRDTVSDYSSDEDTADTLVFSGARTADLWFEKRGSSLVIYAYGDTDSVTVSNYFSGNSYRQLVLVCDDGTLTQADLTERVMPQTGTDGNDSLSGWEYGDSISGGAGHDSLRGNNGDDVLDGGTGNDSLYGGAGNDLLDGGAGDDLLDGGNDSADRYVFREGHGNDMVSDSSKNSTTADTLVFSGAQSSAVRLEKNGNDLLICAYGDEDSVRVSGYFSYADNRHIDLQFDDRTMTAEMLAGQEFLSLGTEANNNLYGWSGTDRLEGQAGDDYMQGYDGQDTLDGGTGNDKLYGGNNSADRYVFREGHGNDMVSDSSKNSTTADTLVFSGAQSSAVRLEKNGNDLLICAYGDEDSVRVSGYFSYADNRHIDLQFDDRTMTAEMLAGQEFLSLGTEANNNLYGWSGTDRLEGQAGDDYMQGYDGQDTLDGGTGNDKLYGGNDSADRYVFREGHGNDMVSDSSKNSTTADTLVFSGAQSSAVRLEKNGNDLLICAYGDEDSVRVSGYFSYADNRHIDLQFDDRTMTAEMLAGQEFLSLGTEANNNLYGWSGTDRLEGQAGDDYMQGYDGQDTLDGGTGNDKLYGGNNSADRYVFREGHGNDMVSDSSKNSTTADTLVFSGAQSSAVRLEKDGNDLLICAYGDEDSVRVSGYFSYADNRHIDLQFDDRTMTAETLAGQEFASEGSATNNTLNGWSGTDRLEGNEGNDSLYGNGGKDTLDGGAGDDGLYGGNDSADRYIFCKGHGHDTVSDYSHDGTTIDTLVFKGANSSKIQTKRSGYHLIIHGYGNEDSVTINNYYHSQNYRFIELRFDDRTLTSEDLGTFTWHWENVSSGRSATPLTSTLSTSNSKEVLISEWPENNTNDLWFQKNDLLGTAVPPSGAAPWGDTESHQLQLMVNAMAGFTTPSEATKSLPEQMQQYMHQLGASAL